MYDLVIVQCVKSKIWDKDKSAPRSVPAKDAYVSSYFKKMRAFAERFGQRWCVLSGGYGFLLPDTKIENYNASFADPKSNSIPVGKVIEHLQKDEGLKRGLQLNRGTTCAVLGGKAYVDVAREALSEYQIEVIDLLKGLKIGEKLKWLDEKVVGEGKHLSSVDSLMLASNPEDTAKKCSRIANKYGERYKKEVMDSAKWTPELLSNDWFSSLEFWFGKSFFRGRRDSISSNFMNKALSVVRCVGKNSLLDISDEAVETSLAEAGVNNHIDRKMVVQTLGFIKKLDSYNIASHCLMSIKQNQTQKVFNELRTIYGIGPKLASLFLRDLCFVYKVEPPDKEQLVCLQPVDTWVRQVAVELGIPGCTQDTHEIEVVEPIVGYCLQNGISPLLFNAGAWYVGSRSFELLLEVL